MKIFTKKEILPIFLILLSFAAGFYFYFQLPDYIPVHWDYRGQIDNWCSKEFIFFLPIVMFFVYVLLTVTPFIDPYKENYSKFINVYFWFKVLFLALFLFIYLLMILAGMGVDVNIIYSLVPAFSFFFIILGFLMPKIKRNYFFGVRTPWTIHNEQVWDKTHQIGGKLYIGAGVISLLGIFVPNFAFLIFITSLIAATIIVFYYSYLLFKKV